MSHSKRKIAVNTLTNLPVPGETEKIARVTELRGSNICEVEIPEGEKFLVQLPTKFRKTVWVKRGNYVIINRPTAWDNMQYKVKAMVQHILFPDQIKYLKNESLWPKEFGVESPVQEAKPNVSKKTNEEEEEDDDLFVNPNHLAVAEESESESDSDAEKEGDEED